MLLISYKLTYLRVGLSKIFSYKKYQDLLVLKDRIVQNFSRLYFSESRMEELPNFSGFAALTFCMERTYLSVFPGKHVIYSQALEVFQSFI